MVMSRACLSICINSQRILETENLEIIEVLDLSALEKWVHAWGESYNANEAKREESF